MIELPPISTVTEVPAPVTFKVITGRRYLHALGEPPDGQNDVRAGRERSTIMIDEQSGLVLIESDYGAYAYHWPPAHRVEDIFTFLAHLDFDYFMNKAAKQPWREIDLRKTIDHHRRTVRGERWQRDITKEEARDRWDALDGLLAEAPATIDEFLRLWHEPHALYSWLYGADVAIVSRNTFAARYFWDVIWKALIESDAFRVHMKRTTRVA
jgi:hypothetical protein